MISILSLLHKINFSLQYHTPVFQLSFVQNLISLKFSLTINQTPVRLLYKILQIILRPYLQDILDTSKFLLQMKNLNITKSTILTLYYTTVHVHTTLKSRSLFHKQTIPYNTMNTVPSHQISLHQLYMTDPNSLPTTSSIYNVQPTPHTSKPRVFPSLPYTTENLKFINKFNFQFSDLSDTEYITLCIF